MREVFDTLPPSIITYLSSQCAVSIAPLSAELFARCGPITAVASTAVARPLQLLIPGQTAEMARCSGASPLGSCVSQYLPTRPPRVHRPEESMEGTPKVHGRWCWVLICRARAQELCIMCVDYHHRTRLRHR